MKKIVIYISFLLLAFNSTAQWNTDRILTIGRNAYYYEDYVLSIQYFNQVIKIKPHLYEPYMFRGMAKISLGDYLGAEQDCNEAIELNPFVPYAYYTRGYARKNLQKYDEAIVDFTKALEFDPGNSHYVANRIEVRERQQDFDGAIEDLHLFKQMNPKAKGIDYEIGRILLSKNDTTAAETMMLRSIEADSTLDMSYKLLAYIKEQKNDLEGAIASLNRLKNIKPNAENLDLELGRLYLSLQDTIMAAESFDRAIYNNPRNARAYGARAFLHMHRNNESAALDDYSKAIAFGSDFAGDYINRGILNVKKYNFNQALSDYNYAILLDRSNSLAYYNRALLRNNLGDKNNALSDLDRVLELDAGNNEARLQQARLQLELGHLDEAITNFENILRAYKYFAPAYYSLAEAYDKKGEKRKAANYRSLVFEIVNNKDYYKKKQELEPQNQIVQNSPTNEINSTKVSLAEKLSTQSENNFKKPDYTDNKLRGKVQESYTELQFPGKALLSFEGTDTLLTETNRFHLLIQNFNQQAKLNKTLRIEISENMMSAGRVNPHFDNIDMFSQEIQNNTGKQFHLYLARAIEFYAVQDYSSALEDLNQAIALDKLNALPYFMRALVRNELMLLARLVEQDEAADKKEVNTWHADDQSKIIKQQILDDYEYIIRLSPDFSFAYYNKGNYLAETKDYRSAIQAYNKAIEIDPFFAEAYFARGLTYIFINSDMAARSDLSKAGELGVYKAYNLLNRLQSKE